MTPMKNLLHIISALMSAILLTMPGFSSGAQSVDAARKNSIRAGAGIHVFGRSADGDGIGPSMYIGYSRKVYDYFSMDLQLYASQSVASKIHYNHRIGASLRGMVRPLAFSRWTRWLEMGAGVTYTYENVQHCPSYVTIEEKIQYSIRQAGSGLFGLDFPIKAYLMDNDRFELSVFYEFNLTFYELGKATWNYSNCGIMFGVKF